MSTNMKNKRRLSLRGIFCGLSDTSNIVLDCQESHDLAMHEEIDGMSHNTTMSKLMPQVKTSLSLRSGLIDQSNKDEVRSNGSSAGSLTPRISRQSRPSSRQSNSSTSPSVSSNSNHSKTSNYKSTIDYVAPDYKYETQRSSDKAKPRPGLKETEPTNMTRVTSIASTFSTRSVLSCISGTYNNPSGNKQIDSCNIENQTHPLSPKVRKKSYPQTILNPNLSASIRNHINKRQRSLPNTINTGPSPAAATTTLPPSSYEVEQGDIPVSIEVPPSLRIPYIHGGYAAVAPIMLQDPKWMNILRRLMPRSHREIINKMIIGRISEEPQFDFTPVKIMKWADSNPVVAAYGVLKGLDRYHALNEKIRTRGWDNLNDESSRDSLMKLPAKNSLEEESIPSTGLLQLRADIYTRKLLYETRQSLKHDLKHKHYENNNSSHNERQQKKEDVPNDPCIPDPTMTALEWDVFLDPTLVRKVDQAMQAAENLKKNKDYDPDASIAYEVEVDRQVTRLLERMLLAHGSMSQLAAEAIGMGSKLNFSRLNRSVHMSKPGESVGGNGLFLPRWLSLFAAALKLGSHSKVFENHNLVDDSPDDSDTETETGAVDEIDLYESKPRVTNNLPKEISREGILDVNSSTHVGQHLVRSHLSSTSHGVSPKYYSHIQTRDDDLTGAPPLCGLFLCLGIDDPTSNRATTSCEMLSSIQSIHEVTGAPLKVVLDLKSRRVPARVWGRLIDHLRARGISVEGIGSFDIPELRAIGSCCSTPLTLIIFFHSAGDLQRACHAKEVKNGDTVYFNAGSLLWQKPNIIEATEVTCCADKNILDDRFTLKLYAKPIPMRNELGGQLLNFSTIQDYQRHFDLKIGVYVQEFSICTEALTAIVQLINKNPHVYNQGLAWGGLNGLTVDGIVGDGFWNQRFMGKNWDINTGPNDKLNLQPEDYKMVRDAFMVDVWGQVGTANDAQEISNAIQAGPCAPGALTVLGQGGR